MGGTAITQHMRQIRADDSEFADRPDMCTVIAEDGISLSSPIYINPGKAKFHLRFLIAETSFTEVTVTTPTLWCNTVNDPTSAFRVTTDGSVNPVRIVDADSPLSDSIDAQWGHFNFDGVGHDRWYIDQSDAWPSMYIGLGGVNANYGELQVCLEFTNNAADGQSYFFFVKWGDGSDLDAYNETSVVTATALTIVTTNLNTAWDISDHFTSFLNSAWEIPETSFNLEWRLAGGPLLGSKTEVVDYQYTIEGLSPNTAYEFRITPIDKNGIPGDASEWIAFGTEAFQAVSSWAIKKQLLQSLAWDTDAGKATLSPTLAWSIKHGITSDVAYHIIGTLDRGTAWGVQQNRSGPLAWVIHDIIPAPVNLQTINITETEARFTWEMP